jgi:hypothetical protein
MEQATLMWRISFARLVLRLEVLASSRTFCFVPPLRAAVRDPTRWPRVISYGATAKDLYSEDAEVKGDYNYVFRTYDTSNKGHALLLPPFAGNPFKQADSGRKASILDDEALATIKKGLRDEVLAALEQHERRQQSSKEEPPTSQSRMFAAAQGAQARHPASVSDEERAMCCRQSVHGDSWPAEDNEEEQEEQQQEEEAEPRPLAGLKLPPRGVGRETGRGAMSVRPPPDWVLSEQQNVPRRARSESPRGHGQRPAIHI